MRFLLFFLFIAFSTLKSFAQTEVRELRLLTESTLSQSPSFYDESKGNDSKWLRKQDANFISKIAISGASAGLFVYQNVLSGQISTGCQYAVSCSNYSKQAIAEYGIFRGILIGLDRLYRCNASTAKHTHSQDRDLDGKIKESVCDIYSKY